MNHFGTQLYLVSIGFPFFNPQGISAKQMVVDFPLENSYFSPTQVHHVSPALFVYSMVMYELMVPQ